MTTKHVLSVDEVAEILSISRNTAYEAVRRGQIPSIRIGKRILVPRAKLMNLIDACEAAGTAA